MSPEVLDGANPLFLIAGSMLAFGVFFAISAMLMRVSWVGFPLAVGAIFGCFVAIYILAQAEEAKHPRAMPQIIEHTHRYISMNWTVPTAILALAVAFVIIIGALVRAKRRLLVIHEEARLMLQQRSRQQQQPSTDLTVRGERKPPALQKPFE